MTETNNTLRDFGAAIRAMDAEELQAIANSTNPTGPLWIAAVAARVELARREGAS